MAKLILTIAEKVNPDVVKRVIERHLQESIVKMEVEE